MIIANIIFFTLNSAFLNSYSVSTKFESILNRNVTERDPSNNYTRTLFNVTYQETTCVGNKEATNSRELNKNIRLISDSSLTKHQTVSPGDSGIYNYTSAERKVELNSRVKRDNRRRPNHINYKSDEERKPSSDLISTVLLISYPNDKEKRVYCSGTLLTTKIVLTSARCISVAYTIDDNKTQTILTDVHVYAGGNSVKEYENYIDNNMSLPNTTQLQWAEDIIPHYYYYEGCLTYDVAVIIVHETFSLTKTVSVRSISPVPLTEDYPRTYANCNTIGFEKVGDDYVKTQHPISVKQPCLCEFRFRALYLLLGENSTLSHWICSMPSDDSGVCIDELGSALICDGKVRGLSLSYLNVGDLNYCEFDPLQYPFHTCGRTNTIRIFQDVCPAMHFISPFIGLRTDEDSAKCKEIGFASRIVPKYSVIIVCAFVILYLRGFHH